ncbi:MAG: hypothetical protein FJ123_09835 [Deltaproteobacteria bacterium]|nr:hypothetical protein [Deltaproteobacteria bacterium]
MGGGSQGSEKGCPLCLWDYLGGKERDDRVSFGLFRVSECLEGFFRDLFVRGLGGKGCEMIMTEGGKGLRNVLEVIYPRNPQQHCWAHKMCNVLDKVNKADQDKGKKIFIGSLLRRIGRQPPGLLVLFARSIEREGSLSPEYVVTLLEDYLKNKKDNRKPLWTLLLWELWADRYCPSP